MMILKKVLMVIGMCSICETVPVPQWNLSCGTRENVTQAIGTNFSVTIVSHCSNKDIDGCLMTYIFEASDNNKDFKRVDVNKTGDNGDRAEASLKNGAVFHYEFRKWDENNSIIFNLTVVSPNKPHAVNLKIKDYFGCPRAAFTFATINFEGCGNNTNFSVTLKNSDIARYMDVGTILCDKNEKGRAIFSNKTEATHTHCNLDAQWNDADNIFCLYPILAQLLVDDNPYSETVELKYNDSAQIRNVSLSCALGNDGSSRNSVIFREDTQMKNISSLGIEPSLNGVNVSCYIKDSYAELFGTDHKSTSTLDIKFGPYRLPGYSSLCSTQDGSVIFYSNPASSGDNLSMIASVSESSAEVDDKIPASIEDCCGVEYGVQGQMITPDTKLQSSSKNLYLRSNYTGNIEVYEVVPCKNVIIETTTGIDGTPTASPTQLTLPIAGGLGGLALILIIIIACLCYQRRCNGKSEVVGEVKVDRANPLYDTSDNLAHATSAKEDVINPLYGTAQCVDGDVNVYSTAGETMTGREPDHGDGTYSVVNKKQKINGKENPAFNEPDEDGATYSVVNKKKKKKGKQTANPPDASETDTYAVVDRSKKKDKQVGKEGPNLESHPESAASMYAQVDRTAKKKKNMAP